MRDAAVYVVALFMPLALAASIWPRWSGALRRSGELLVVVIGSKFVIVSIISLAAGLIAESDGRVEHILAASALMLLACFSPFVLLQLVPFAEGAMARAYGRRSAAGGTSGGGAQLLSNTQMVRNMARSNWGTSLPGCRAAGESGGAPGPSRVAVAAAAAARLRAGRRPAGGAGAGEVGRPALCRAPPRRWQPLPLRRQGRELPGSSSRRATPLRRRAMRRGGRRCPAAKQARVRAGARLREPRRAPATARTRARQRAAGAHGPREASGGEAPSPGEQPPRPLTERRGQARAEGSRNERAAAATASARWSSAPWSARCGRDRSRSSRRRRSSGWGRCM